MKTNEMTKQQILVRSREIMDELDELDGLCMRENRKFTEEENMKYGNLQREHIKLVRQLEAIGTAAEVAKIRENRDKSTLLREYIQSVKQNRENATTILQNAVTTGTDQNMKGNLEAGALVPITVKDMVDTMVEGINLPKGMRITLGATGDEVYPYSIDDVELRVAGEIETAEAQALHFDHIKALSERVTASVPVSNNALDNAVFDLYSFVVYKFQKAMQIMWVRHTLSHAKFTHHAKSPLALVDVETIVLDDNFAENLAVKVAEIAEKGFTGVPELVIDKVTEARLSFRPRIAGNPASGTVIQDGKLAGFDYVTNSNVNGELNTDGKYVIGKDRYIGIGFWDMVAVEQRGDVRFTIDATSAAVSSKNSTVFTLNTNISITELSSKVNGNTDDKPQAFKLLKIVTEPETV